ncbi:MAG TPA: protein kinase [Gemmatimonadales bacterium]|nr:protein kinase [Gemmatimonadales bacterium]
MNDPVAALRQALAGRYVIERELGQGGMATVYLAQDVRHDRRVALKVVRPDLAAILGGERFLAEIKTTANLQHPHILSLFDSGEAGGLVWYVMPYVDGESLRDRLRREKQLPVEEAVRIAREVADALQHAHGHGIVHRDIKPENILLHGGHALVADFGIALAASRSEGGARMTETGMSLGTPQYMAPEQAMGEREISPRADVYALGCVLYEMLVGEPPFTGPTAQAIVAKVMTAEPPSPAAVRRTVPPEVDAAVLQALEKLPADRFASAAEFAAALVGGAATVRRPAGRSSRRPVVPPVRPIHGAIGVAALALAALLGWLARRPPALPEPTRVRVVMTPDSNAPAAAHECCSPAVEISPDGRYIAYIARLGGVLAVYVRDRDGFEPRVVYPEGAKAPFFSPDGERMGLVGGVTGTVSSRTMLVTGSIEGHSWSPVTAFPGTDPTGIAWASDGTIVLADLTTTGLMRVPAEGGAPEVFTRPDTAAGEERHLAPHFVPEVNGILFTIWMRAGGPAEARIALASLADGRVRVIGRGLRPQYTRAGYLVSATPDGAILAQRMDLRSGTADGAPIRIAEGVSVRGQWTADYAVSREGTLVYDVGHAEATVNLVGLSGETRHVPLDVEGVRHWDNPRFSPDGRYVVAAGQVEGIHQAFVLDLERGTSLRHTFEGNTEFIDWTPDGRRLVFVKAGTKLAEQAADRSGSERIVWEGDGSILGRVSVRGDWIAVGRSAPGQGGTGSDILVLRRDSAAPRTYLATRFEEVAPTISPDGRWLAYVSNETGRPEVYVGAFPDAAAGRRLVSTRGGAEPQWSADGRTLYYRARGGVLVAHEVQAAPELLVGPARQLFAAIYDESGDAADYDVHPDDDRFVMVTTRPVGSRLVWILNAVPAR